MLHVLWIRVFASHLQRNKVFAGPKSQGICSLMQHTWVNSMVKIVCVSHSPLMEYNQPEGSVKADVRGTFAGLAKDIAVYDPELIVLFAPDHYNGMFYDMMPSFCVGIRATACGDWNSGQGDLSVPEEIAMQLLKAVRSEGIDAALS